MARRIRTAHTRRIGVRAHLEHHWQAHIDRLHPRKGDDLPPPYPRLLETLRAGEPVTVPAFVIRDYLPPATDPASVWTVGPDESIAPADLDRGR